MKSKGADGISKRAIQGFLLSRNLSLVNIYLYEFTMNPLQSVLLTLQYCMEIFQASCQCQCCEPCTQGQKNIQRAMRTIEGLLRPSNHNQNTNIPIVRYALERQSARAEFENKAALLYFMREMLPPGLQLEENADTTEIAAKAATRQWTLLEFEPGQYAQCVSLLQTSLNVIHLLLETTELNMDELETSTRETLCRATSFQNVALRMGFHHNCNVLPGLVSSPSPDLGADSSM